jgi:hypothetical protein
MRRRLPRLAIWIAAVALVLAVAGLALDPLATWRTRRTLAGLEGMRATFSDVDVDVLAVGYTIRGLRIEKVAAGGAALPFFEADRIRLRLNWRELVRGDVVARADLDAPTLNVIQKQAKGEPAEAQQVQEVPELGRKLRDLAPFLLDRAQVRDGEIRVVDASEPERPTVRFHEIELTLENFATRPALSRGEPTVLAARGTLQRSGRVSLFATADPLAKHVTFAGQGRVEGLKIAELGDVIGARSDVAPDQGVLDMSIRVRAEDGRISGGVRPFLKDGGTRPADPGLGARLKSALADGALELFDDDRGGRDAVATTIPIAGTLRDPQAQPIPTAIGVLRNAFVRGLADSLSGLPPPKAAEREGVLEQARRGLSRGGQPRAQPRDEKEKR